MVPIKPIKTPRTCRRVQSIPNTNSPTKTVAKGVKLLRMETTELSICRCAMAKKNGGKKELTKPVIASHFQCTFFTCLKLFIPTENKMKEVSTIRKAPN